jgi:long-chain acyl-CoA synthetase
MYPGTYAAQNPDRPAFIMAPSGESLTYAELEANSNRLAHLLRSHGLHPGDHYSVFMENNATYMESCVAGERSGLYYTCINSYLKPDEVAYIVNNSESQALITSVARLDVAREAMKDCPNISLCLVVGDHIDEEGLLSYSNAVSAFPTTPINDEVLGTAMLYSSGTTGRPKGILRPLPPNSPSEPLPVFHFLKELWKYREDMMYLSPAPLYHAAPLAAVSLTVRFGGTTIIMERFDPEAYLSLVEKYSITHSQLVPTMFSRMLKLPAEIREKYDLSSLEVAIHAAAPCPVPVKAAMIDWWGPIIDEYYGATEALGFTASTSEEWLAHQGSVGRVLLGDLHILDDDMQPVAQGGTGQVWFKTASPFEYFKDPQKTAEVTSPDGTMTTVGDIGYVDEDGFLYLTDRATFMIISGGVNIYPQECENLLITHPKIADAAVFGIPNADLGEEVKAVVQLMPEIPESDALGAELIDFCREHMSNLKCPRSIDFTEQLPRLPTGKLYKKDLRDKYWPDTNKVNK